MKLCGGVLNSQDGERVPQLTRPAVLLHLPFNWPPQRPDTCMWGSESFSCPVVPFILAKKLQTMAVNHSPRDISKVPWFHPVMKRWLLSPKKKSRMSHLKRVLLLLHHNRFTTDNPFWTRACGLLPLLLVTIRVCCFLPVRNSKRVRLLSQVSLY